MDWSLYGKVVTVVNVTPETLTIISNRRVHCCPQGNAGGGAEGRFSDKEKMNKIPYGKRGSLPRGYHSKSKFLDAWGIDDFHVLLKRTCIEYVGDITLPLGDTNFILECCKYSHWSHLVQTPQIFWGFKDKNSHALVVSGVLCFTQVLCK